MKLTINLATRRYINVRRLNTGLAASILLAAALLVYQVREIANNQVAINKIRSESAAASRGSAGEPAVNPELLQELDAKIDFGNRLIARKTMNWVAVLDKLEGVVPAGVSLSQVKPSLKDQTLQLAGVARSFSELRTLLENMEESPNFSEVYLLSQNDVKVGKTQQGLGFNISCKVSYQ